MKLVALKNIYRVPAMERIKAESPTHPNQIDKGTVFEIGTAAEAKDLSHEEKQLAYLLNQSGCIGNGNDPKVVDAVRREIESEKKSAANVVDANLNAAATGLLTQFAQILAQMHALAETGK